MKAKNYRKAMRHFTAPVRPAHFTACAKWQRQFEFGQFIRREIAPKLAVLNLLDTDDGFRNSRFSSYQATGQAGKVQQSSGRGSYSPYSMGSQDSTDLAAENSFAHSLAGAVSNDKNKEN